MIFVRMGRDDAEQLVLAFDDEGRVRHDHIDASMLLLTKSDAAIEHQPLVAVGVEVEVHPDLAAAAERDEIQPFSSRSNARSRAEAAWDTAGEAVLGTRPFGTPGFHRLRLRR